MNLENANEFVLAAKLASLKLQGPTHLWQVVNGERRSLTNSVALATLEKILDFNEEASFQLMAKTQGGTLGNGFYWVNHHLKTGNYFLCNGWTEEFEKFLIAKGVILPAH